MTRRQLIDVGPAVVLAAAALAEARFALETRAPVPVVALFVLGTTVPLAWRRTAPLTVLAAVLASVALPEVRYGLANSLSTPFVGLIVASYASGAYTNRRDGRVSAMLILVMLAAIAAAADEDRLGDGIFVGGLLLGVWGAGTIVRGRQELAAALQARTLELERERELNARLAVAAERARIARELHDVVAHDLSIMVVQAGAERRALAGARPETADVLATIEATGRTAMAEMRRMLGVLRRSADDVALAPQPTLRRLDELVTQVREAGLPVELRVEGQARPLAPGVDLSAYRIVQEALTNALKHAGPAHACVVVRYGDEALDVEVTDDGAGGAAAPAGGHGLIGMRERVAILGGRLDAGRRPGGGYAVRATLPLAGGEP